LIIALNEKVEQIAFNKKIRALHGALISI